MSALQDFLTFPLISLPYDAGVDLKTRPQLAPVSDTSHAFKLRISASPQGFDWLVF